MIRFTQKSGYFGRPKGRAASAAFTVAALIAFEAVRLWSVLAPLAHWDTSDRRPPGKANVGLHTARVDVASIATAHLFGASNENPTGFGAAVATSNSNLLLTGTFARRNPERGVAIIRDAGASRLYAVGARLGDATVAAVFRDHVILNRNGALESLSLPRPAALGGPVSQGSSPAELVASNDSSAPSDPHDLADVMRVGGPVNDPTGRMRGFRIFPGRDRKAFGALGLHGGDVVVAVNGTPMLEQDRQSSQELFKTVGTAERATMTIERNGHTSEITVDVAQAGLPSNSSVPAPNTAEN